MVFKFQHIYYNNYELVYKLKVIILFGDNNKFYLTYIKYNEVNK